MQHHVPVFDRSIQKSREWLHDISRQLNQLDDQHAYSLLRAVLQTLRDRLSIDEAAQFSAQLPLVLRGTFYEGWNPSYVSARMKTRGEFIEHVAQNLTIPLGVDLEKAVMAACQVIRRHISPGEMADIASSLPDSIKPLFQEVRDGFSPL